MLLLLSAAAVVALAPQVPERRDSLDRRDSVAADSARPDSLRGRRVRRPARTPVTPALLANAFDDPGARTLLSRARVARLRQDSALVSYDASTFMRLSAGIGLGRWARDRLAARAEQAARIRWHRDRGAWIDVKGRRAVAPILAGIEDAEDDVEDDLEDEDFSEIMVPYFPGREPLFVFGTGIARAEIDESEIIHPLVRGSEAYYRYASGDSLEIRFGDGRRITVRELRVRPRKPRWQLVVGSFWFDAESGILVRAAYRFSEPFELWSHLEEEEPHEIDDIPRVIRPMMSTIRADLTSVTLEFGLYEGRFWLPRTQVAEGRMTAVGMRVPFSLNTAIQYASVNGEIDIPAFTTRGPGDTARTALDSLRDSLIAAISDSLRRAREREDDKEVNIVIGSAPPDSVIIEARARRLANQVIRERTRGRLRACDTSTVSVRTNRRFDGRLPMAIAVPCDQSKLATAPELPPSIYDPDEEVFDHRARDELRQALGLDAQAEWEPQRPAVRWGLGGGLLRYNRIEGLAPAVSVEQRLGAGMRVNALARLATAQVKASSGELSGALSSGRKVLGVGIYRRLAVANDFEQPLSFGGSLAALLMGRDDGLYHYATGAEMTGIGEEHPRVEWRLFLERHATADIGTRFSIPAWIGDTEFEPNLIAQDGDYAGMGFRTMATFGQNPTGFRLLADARFESAARVDSGGMGYTRLAGDATLSRALSRRLAASLTAGSGVIVGDAPVQRHFFLGGPRTVRGQSPGAQVGTMYWLTRTEVGFGAVAARPTAFFDLGWAGSRFEWREPGATTAGAGVGASFLDGMLRVDLARGIRPETKWRLDFYLEGRF